MSDKEIIELLRDAFLSDDAPPLTGEEAEVLLTAPVTAESTPAAVVKARSQFVEKLLADFLRKPLRLDQESVTFGEGIKRVREYVHLTLEDIGEAVGQDAAFVAGLENEEPPPWTVEPDVMEKIVVLFRLHEDTVKRLMAASLWKVEYRQTLESMIRGPHTPPGDLMAAMIDPSEKHSTSPGEETEELSLREEVADYLSKLRNLLVARGAHDLLSEG